MRIGFCELEGRSGHEAGRLLLRQLYEEETGEEMPPILITERGKPCFAHGDYHFSISHTPKHAFCVLAKGNVGLDAEEQDRDINLKLAGKILSPAELARFQRAEDPRRALLKLWVLKEADAKRSGLGLRGYPNHTDFSPEDPRIQEIAGCYVAVLEERE